MSDITKRRKSLILSQKVYQYILNTYGNKSELTLMCFEDILTLRIFIDTEHESELSECTYDSIKSTFDLYNKASVPYKPAQLDLLKQATNFEIIRPFFDDFLPTIFGFKSKPKKKRKKLDDLALLWVEQLEHINSQNYIGIPTTLKDLFMNFYKRLENEEIIIKYHIQGDIYRQHKKQKQNNINVNFNNMYY
ncbi:12874_t:CDS:1 [Funneliformis geosporum]|uniref:12874_t:CDS:1 n=1 Tax=Funneliformis geosporum TaxID=1117311 RepID=A0A9W4WMB5_9GLOM|nr:12874_t:CDS:1 [Funneliformis geosporum]